MSYIIGVILSFSSYANADATCTATVVCQSCGEGTNSLEPYYATVAEKEAWNKKCKDLGGTATCSNYGGCKTWVCEKWFAPQAFPISSRGFSVKMARDALNTKVEKQQNTYVCSGGNICGPCRNGRCGSRNINSVKYGQCIQPF